MDDVRSDNNSNDSESTADRAGESADLTNQKKHPQQQASETPTLTPSQHHKVKSWVFRIALILIILLLIRWAMTSYHHLKIKKVEKVVAVVVESAKKTDMPIYIPALGTVTPLETVTVKTQINGLLQKVWYKEGQKVNAGDLLAEIDPRPYEAQLEQFQGQLARDEALLVNAKIDLERYEKLFKEDSVAQQTLETQRWLVKQLEGTIKLDQGQIDQVKVNLIYCRITSPIDGQVGLRLVDPGNFVQTTDTTGLVVINTIQPITVIFAIPEDSLPQVLQQNAGGKDLIVEAYDRAQKKLLATGKVLTVDNQINTTTGTVKIRAIFDNEEKMLFPNQFVNVQLKVSTLQDATVVPRTALQYGAAGTFVFVVNKKDDKTVVNVKPIAISAMVRDDVAIVGDILPNQEVVVEGADLLTENTVIRPEARTNNKTQGSLNNPQSTPNSLQKSSNSQTNGAY
jgi:multidrug efflux system membrane fusion protein